MERASLFGRRGGRGLVCIGVLVMALVSPGCVDGSQLLGLRGDAQLVRDEIAVEATRLESAASDPTLSEEVRVANAQAATRVRSRLDDLDATITALDRVIASEQNPEAIWSAVSESVVPILPEPFRSPILLIGALGLALARAAQLKRAAGSIAKGIAKAAEKDGEFRSVFDRHADTFRGVQTPAAQRIVDEKVRPGFMMRLPI